MTDAVNNPDLQRLLDGNARYVEMTPAISAKNLHKSVQTL